MTLLVARRGSVSAGYRTAGGNTPNDFSAFTGTVRNFTSDAEFDTAYAAAVAGDRLVLNAAGSYSHKTLNRPFASPGILITYTPGLSFTHAGFDFPGGTSALASPAWHTISGPYNGSAPFTFSSGSTVNTLNFAAPTNGGTWNKRLGITLQDLQVSAGKNGIFVNGGTDSTQWINDLAIRRCLLTGLVEDAININGAAGTGVDYSGNCVVEGCTMWDLNLSASAIHNDGIQIQAGSNIVVRRNEMYFTQAYIDANNGTSVIVGTTDVNQAILVGRGNVAWTVDRILIENNLVHDWIGNPVQITGASNVKVVFNTVDQSTLFAAGGQRAFTLADSVGTNTNITVVGDVLHSWQTNNTPTGTTYDSNHVIGAGGLGTNLTTGASTGFDSSGPTGHFALNAGHAGLGTATSATALANVPTVDYYGTTRVANHDRGAVES